MSSFIRNIQRNIKRGKYYLGRGYKLGYTDPKGKEKVAREARASHKGSVSDCLSEGPGSNPGVRSN